MTFTISVILFVLSPGLIRSGEYPTKKPGGSLFSSLNKHLSDAEIDFTYLSNPGRVKKYLIKKNKLEYSYFESSRIFNSIEHFTENSRKQTKILKKDIHD